VAERIGPAVSGLRNLDWTVSNADAAFGNQSDGRRVGGAFLFKDAGREGVGIVGGQYLAGSLQDGCSVVVPGIHQMHGAATLSSSRRQNCFVDGAAMHTFASEVWKQRGVDVDDAVYHPWQNRQQAKVAAEADKIGSAFLQNREYPVID
jgi:hypothetical protein